MTDAEVIEAAVRIANQAHAGQLDKIGRPYMGHLERVASMVQRSGGTWVQVAAAWLHDSIEDTSVSADELRRQLPGVVVRIVEAMTHPKGEPNVDYWARVKSEPSAVLVKQCDVYDNLDPSRMCYLDELTQVRLRAKYAEAIKALVSSVNGDK